MLTSLRDKTSGVKRLTGKENLYYAYLSSCLNKFQEVTQGQTSQRMLSLFKGVKFPLPYVYGFIRKLRSIQMQYHTQSISVYITYCIEWCLGSPDIDISKIS